MVRVCEVDLVEITFIFFFKLLMLLLEQVRWTVVIKYNNVCVKVHMRVSECRGLLTFLRFLILELEVCITFD